MFDGRKIPWTAAALLLERPREVRVLTETQVGRDLLDQFGLPELRLGVSGAQLLQPDFGGRSTAVENVTPQVLGRGVHRGGQRRNAVPGSPRPAFPIRDAIQAASHAKSFLLPAAIGSYGQLGPDLSKKV